MAKRRRSHQPYSLSNYTNDHFSSGLLLAVALAFSLHEQQCCRALMGSMIWASEMLVSSVRWKRTVIHAQHKYRSIHCIDFRIIERKKSNEHPEYYITTTTMILTLPTDIRIMKTLNHCNKSAQNIPKITATILLNEHAKIVGQFFFAMNLFGACNREKKRERARYASNKCLQLRN